MLLMPVLAWAEVTVIFDSGNTRSLAPYLEILEPSERVNNNQPTRSNTLGAADIQTLLPICSPGLSPGPVQSRAHNRPFARPFFLIGSDPRSRQWLVKHRERLKAIGAVGMLVQADSLEDLQATASLSGGLPIMPASAADIANVLGISHYPVLVTSQGIEQ
jgi:integrating conjugative element protein (TIGR03765 family)